jgi:hypothetical protein
MEVMMLKKAQIDAIIATRDRELMLAALWDDPEIIGKIRSKLEKVSAENIKYYHAHFCNSKREEKRS